MEEQKGNESWKAVAIQLGGAQSHIAQRVHSKFRLSVDTYTQCAHRPLRAHMF